MTFDNKTTKDNSEFQLLDLLESDRDLLPELLQMGLQKLMELERDEHIGAEHYERSQKRRTTRNGYKPRQLYTRSKSLRIVLGAFLHSTFKKLFNSVRNLLSISFSNKDLSP